MIERRNPPQGWALPGGFVEYGEKLEDTARREAEEETSIRIELIEQFYTYSDPSRDPRHHTISTVFIAKGQGYLRAGDDAKRAGIFSFTEKRPVGKDNFIISINEEKSLFLYSNSILVDNKRETPATIAFDHADILLDYFLYKKTGNRPSIKEKNNRR